MRPPMHESSETIMQGQQNASAVTRASGRNGLRERNVAEAHALVEASERKLTRFGFDLHDGPLQDLVVLGEDLRQFGDQLGSLTGISDGEHQLLRGRLEDLGAQLEAVEA